MDVFSLDAAYFEKSLMDQLGSHGNISCCEAFYEDNEYILTVSELMEKDMRDVINDLNKPLKEQHAKNIVYQILTAVEHCHSLGIMHRDIKLENVLIKRVFDSAKAPAGFQVKLTDFGIACMYDEHDKPTLRCGTSIALSPEVIKGQAYSPKIDCWSIGVILHELLSNKLPFYSH